MNISAYIVATLSAVIGIGSIIVFTVFLYVGPFHLVSLALNNTELLLFDTGLALAFFLQHSLMVRAWFKHWLIQIIPARYYAAVFAIISGIFLWTFMLFWQESPISLFNCQGTCHWIIRSIFFAILIIQGWGLWSLKEIDLFGIKTLTQPAISVTITEPILIVGAYRWVRHPIYFTSILLVWLYPNLTLDRLLLNVLFTLWIIIGAILEERDLVTIHGEAYKNYQRMVPMLIPYRKLNSN